MANLDELRKALNDTSRVVYQITTERDHKRHDRIATETERIDAELSTEYGEKLRDAGILVRAANVAYYAALEVSALAGEGCPVPIGTKLVKWESTNRYERGKLEAIAFGVVEAVTSQTVHPSNAADYSKADIGTFIIRMLKKDGTTGSKYERFQSFHKSNRIPRGWYPDGVDPNKK